MKKNALRFSAAAIVACLLFSCQKDLSRKAETDLIADSESMSVTTLTTSAPCGQLRTQTQGGWGAEPSGNNSGTYLHANFQEAFGELTVGCYPNNYYVKLTSAQAITNLLPVGGKPATLTADYVDPASLKNVLVGQLVALKLSVGFDAWDENFGQSTVSLGNMIIGSGAFEGVPVSEFLAIAEEILGGCRSNFTVQQVVQTASSINQNFVDGKTNNGFLVCPDENDGGNDIPL